MNWYCKTCADLVDDEKPPSQCENSPQVVAWDDEDDPDVFYNCPGRFIPNTISQWHKAYLYEQEFDRSIHYTDRNVKYMEALEDYKYWREYWHSIMHPKKTGR